MPDQAKEIELRSGQVNLRLTPAEEHDIRFLAEWYGEPKAAIVRHRSITQVIEEARTIRERITRVTGYQFDTADAA